MTWEEAKAACEAKGGHLATITSAEENKFIGSLIGDGSGGLPGYWLGGYRTSVSANDWKWVTGASLCKGFQWK